MLAATAPAGESQGDGTLATRTFEDVAIKSSTLQISKVRLVNAAVEHSLPMTEDTAIEMLDPTRRTRSKWTLFLHAHSRRFHRYTQNVNTKIN